LAKVLVLLAEGFEEIEAITIVDVLRRAEVSVTTAGLTTERVVGAHHIAVEADVALDAVLTEPFDAVILPGGMPGSRHLRDDPRVKRLLVEQAKASKWVAAICAAPIALEAAGVLQGRRATSYPGEALPSATYVDERVVVDGKVVTSRAPGTALEFALTLVEVLTTKALAQQLRRGMLVA
jgi:4-methyl-5(b-hydroxyethyl)-thiazole monophosphate biosynthesis